MTQETVSSVYAWTVSEALQFNLSKETSHTFLVRSLVHFVLEAPVL